jgi:membrane protein DedA with SNARE-associated domain
MVEFLGDLTNFVVNLASSAGYPGIVLAMALENLFPPIPSEAVMPLAGYLVTTGRFGLFSTIFSGVLGTVLGAVVLYFIGVLVGNLGVRKFLDRYGRFLMTTSKDLDSAEKWFTKRGEKSVFLCRMVPIVRSIISIPAGFVRMPLKKFVFLTVLGTTVWTSLLTFAGVVLGENWERVGSILKKFDVLVVVVAVVLVGYYFFRKYKNSKSQISNLKSQ